MKRNVFGTVMTYYQKKYDLAANAVYDGICSATTFARMENDERDADFLVQETLLARMGKDITQFEISLSDEDYDLWMERLAIRSFMWDKNIALIEKTLNEYRVLMPKGHALHEQFCLFCEAKLAELGQKPGKIICETAQKALSLTKNIQDVPDKKKNLYTSMELELLLTLIQYRYGEWKNSQNSEKCLKSILEYIEFYYPEEGMEDIKGTIWVELLKIEYAENKFEEMLSDIEKAIKSLCKGTGILRLGQVRFMKAKVLERIGNGADGSENWRRNCMEECKMAYCIFEVMGREEQVREIEDFCQEKLQWHITI